MIRFDPSTRTLTLSVRDLADEEDYRFAGPAPVSLKRRAELGRLEHEAHQGSREVEHDSYRRERSVRWETRLADWRVVVTGRIDGIYSDADGRTVIEEVKTIVGPPEELARADEETFPAYTRQLQLYRYLLEQGSQGLGFSAGPAPEIALHLCLIALPSRERRVLELGYQAAACQELVERRLQDLLDEYEQDLARETRRRHARGEVRFPHERVRPAQAEMMEAVGEALARRLPVLVSAPPGVGKTAGVLIPALQHAWDTGGQVFVATSKTTQQAIFAKTIRLLRQGGTPVRAVVLQAREKACLNHVVDCRAEACRWARDYQAKLSESGALERLLEGGLADPAALEQEGRRHEFCPFEAALDLTHEVDVIVGDYNYAFDPGATLRRLFLDDDPKGVVLVIDEAHNLYERGMAYYSPELSGAALRELERALAGRSDPLSRQAQGVARRLIDHVALLAAGGGEALPAAPPSPEPEAPTNRLLFDDPAALAAPPRRKPSARAATPPPPPPPPPPPVQGEPAGPVPEEREVQLELELFTGLRDEMSELAVAWFAAGLGSAGGEQPLLELNRLLSRFAGVLELGGPEFSWVSRRAEGGSLKALCKDPSRLLGRRIRACGGAVAVSATLEPLEFYRDVLGFGPDALLRAFPSPFDPRNRRVLVLDRPSTSYRRRDRDLPIVEDAVRAVAASRRGNYLVCCSSFEYLDKLAARLDDVPGYAVLRQERSMDESSRQAVLDRLAEGAEGQTQPVLLLVVQGGIFTEGVDYPGELCVGAVIVGPGLPRVGFERELIQAWFQRERGRGFEYAYLYPGMNKVIQAAGRVIRTPRDQGVVVLVGDRFATPRYANLFPRDWYARHPRELISHDPYGDLRRFWAGLEAKAEPPPGEAALS